MGHGRWLMATLVALSISLGAPAPAPASLAPTPASPAPTATVTDAATATETPAQVAAPATPQPAFRQVMGSPFPAGAGPTAVAFSPDGQFLAVADYQLDAVGIYAVLDDGELHRVPGSPFPTGSGPVSLAFSPSGHTLLIADLGADALTVDAVGTTGVLSPERTAYRLAGPPYGVTYSPNGRLIATADSTGDAVQLIAARPSGVPGRLSTEQVLSTGSDPTSVAFSPNSRLLAVAEHGAAAIAAYRLGPNGSLPTLTALTGSPVATVAPADTISFNREGTRLAASDYDAGQVDLLSTSAAGIAPAPEGAIPTGAGSGPDSARFSPVADRLAVALGTANETAFYQVDPGLTPSPLVGSPLLAGTGPTALAFNPQGTLLATADIYSNSVSVYASTEPPPAVIRLPTGRTAVRHRHVTIRVICAALVDRSPGHICRGSVTLLRRGRRLSHARFTLAPGTGTTLRLHLLGRSVGLTAGHRQVAVRETASARGAQRISRTLVISR